MTGPLRPGDQLDVTIERPVYRGQGLARHLGQVVFVPRGLPGERLRVRVESVTSGYARAVPEAVLAAGAGRRPSPCPVFDRCGGCAFQDVDYATQLRIKEDVLRDALARSGLPWAGRLPVKGSPEEGWRMRASFHLEGEGAALRLGLREEGTHRVVDVERCLQVSERMSRAARALVAALRRRPEVASGIQDVDLAESRDGRQLVIALVTDLRPEQAPPLAALMEALPWATGLGAMVRDHHRHRFLPLRGDPHVDSLVGGFRLRAHVRSFFQANRFLVDDLVQEVIERTPAGGRVLDLYAGVGLFALPLARHAESVRGVELNPTAVEDAAANVRHAGLANVRIMRGDVRKGLTAWRAEAGERILLDPPRTGAGRDVVQAIAARGPSAIVYVSCDPPTLGRDLKLFAAEGYSATSVSAFDLFPDTFHLETVVQLVRR